MSELHFPKIKIQDYNPNIRLTSNASPFQNQEDKLNSFKKIIFQSKQKTSLNINNKVVTNIPIDNSQESDTEIFFSKIKQPKRLISKIQLLKKSEKDNKNYSSSKMIGKKAVSKFYQSYKHLGKLRLVQEFKQINNLSPKKDKQNPITTIVKLLQAHNFSPRTLNVIKLKGKQQILDLNQLGLGKSSMGSVVTELIRYLQFFQQVNLSSNSIDKYFCQPLINSLKCVKIINLSKNKIGKFGCQRLVGIMQQPNCSIISINIDDNFLLDYYAAQFLKYLQTFNKLKILSMKKNSLSKKCAYEISNLLKNNQIIEEVYLSWNDFKQKQTNLIMDGLSQNDSVMVFDYSWNRIGYAVQKVQKLFQQNTQLLHLDISFCQIDKVGSQKLKIALDSNNTIYGVHFEGNSGYIDQNGYLQVCENEYVHYPQPLIKGFVRSIDSVKPNFQQNVYNQSLFVRDICWICNSWQQINISISDQQFPQVITEAYVHFKHQRFKSVKLAKIQKGWQIYKLCPQENILFFFTIYTQKSNRMIVALNNYQKEVFAQTLQISLGKVTFKQQIKELNIYHNQYQNDAIDKNYQVLVKSMPRNITQIKKKFIKIKIKNKVQVQTIVKQYFTLPPTKIRIVVQPKLYLSKEFARKCLQNDIQKSKIASIFGQWAQFERFKSQMESGYFIFARIFYDLAKFNIITGNFTVNQKDLIKFCRDIKILPNNLNSDHKIFLKLFQALGKKKNSYENQSIISSKQQLEKYVSNENESFKYVSRSAFLQFTLNLVVQKWQQMQKNQGLKSQISNHQNIHITDIKIQSVKGLKKMLQQYRKQDLDNIQMWRKQIYLTNPDINFVLTKYQKFLKSLFKFYQQRQAVKKQSYQKMLLTLDDCKTMFVQTQIQRTKQVMKGFQDIFIRSKRIEIQDSQMNGINFQEFLQLLTRFSQKNWIETQTLIYSKFKQILNETNISLIPLFLRLQCLLIKLCLKIPFLADKQTLKLAQTGLFDQQLPIIIKCIEDKLASQSLSKEENCQESLSGIAKQKQSQIQNKVTFQRKLSLKYIYEKLNRHYGVKIIKSQNQIEVQEIVEQND